MLAPQWTKPKIGPLLRGEKDLRYYTNLFSSAGYLRGVTRWTKLAWSRRIGEADGAAAVERGENGLIVFDGMEHMYSPLEGHSQFLHQRLLEILTPACRQRLDETEAPEIAVHVRRGDTVPLEYGQEWHRPMGNRGMPDEWYVRLLASLRETIGTKMTVTVFSDGRPDELRTILSQPNVILAADNPPIVDILTMARSKILVPTLFSTFSLWSAFLGSMPVVWYPGDRFLIISDRSINVSMRGDWDA